MKTILSLILTASIAIAAPGDFLFTKIGTPNSPVLRTPVDGQVLYWNGTTLGNYDIATALAGKQPLATVLTNTTASFTTAQESKLAGIEAGATAGGATGDSYATSHEADTTAHTAANIVNTPAGTIAATTVQGALNELDSEKAPVSTTVTLAGTQTITGSKDFTSPMGATTISANAIDSVSYQGFDGSNGNNWTLTTPSIRLSANRAYTTPNASGVLALTDQTDGKLNGADITTGNIATARIATALTTPGPIGGTTPAAISATTVTASGAVTFSTTGTGISLHGGAAITGASGAIAIVASGTHQNVSLSPSGAGSIAANGNILCYGDQFKLTNNNKSIGFRNGGLNFRDVDASTIEINNGTAGTYRDLLLRNLTATGTVTGSNFKRGTGSPESVVSGSVGDLYTRTDGGAGTTLYVKESGSATTTGWVAK